MAHISVLVPQTLALLGLREGDVVLDGTVGSGGHAEKILGRIEHGVFIGLDVDRGAIERSREKLEKKAQEVGARLHLVEENFRNLDRVLEKIGQKNAHAILFDLGWSTEQIEESGRGFSFLSDEPLLMTLGQGAPGNILTARDILNTFSEERLADLIYMYGEEQFSRRIAKGIVERRKDKKFETTRDLVEVIEMTVPMFYLKRRIHAATKTFQALRIAVNDELGALREGLEKAIVALSKGGRLAVITFHSLEDRIVKHAFREWTHAGRGTILTKKPITAGQAEILANRRARSAKLRGFERV